MVRPGPRRALGSLVAATLFLVAAALAYAAASHTYSGKTSQRRPISFKVSGGFVRKLDYQIVDRCPHGQKLINHDYGFSPIRISDGKFGGVFFDRNHHGKAVVRGTMSRGAAHGSLSDRTRNSKTHKFCTGAAEFRLARR
jgi:hypothetical protein